MKPIVVLDSSPLGLLFQRPGISEVDQCREWMANLIANRVRIIVPEIAFYELRRELLRLNKTKTLTALSTFARSVPDRYLPLTTPAMDLASELWAQVRQRGLPTANPHALDADVILAAQVLSAGLTPADFVVATNNVAHLARFVPAELWSKI